MTDADTIGAIKEVAADELAHHGWRWTAWVILSDHLHAMVEPAQQVAGLNSGFDYPALVRGFKVAVNRRLDPLVDIQARWQDRYWEHCIRNDADRKRHGDYIHWNPVKHGLAAHPAAWPHSSFHHYVKAGWYPDEWHPATPPELPGGQGE